MAFVPIARRYFCSNWQNAIATKKRRKPSRARMISSHEEPQAVRSQLAATGTSLA
jgi:hypothetical protein